MNNERYNRLYVTGNQAGASMLNMDIQRRPFIANSNVDVIWLDALDRVINLRTEYDSVVLENIDLNDLTLEVLGKLAQIKNQKRKVVMVRSGPEPKKSITDRVLVWLKRRF